MNGGAKRRKLKCLAHPGGVNGVFPSPSVIDLNWSFGESYCRCVGTSFCRGPNTSWIYSEVEIPVGVPSLRNKQNKKDSELSALFSHLVHLVALINIFNNIYVLVAGPCYFSFFWCSLSHFFYTDSSLFVNGLKSSSLLTFSHIFLHYSAKQCFGRCRVSTLVWSFNLIYLFLSDISGVVKSTKQNKMGLSV